MTPNASTNPVDAFNACTPAAGDLTFAATGADGMPFALTELEVADRSTAHSNPRTACRVRGGQCLTGNNPLAYNSGK
jgi:hypothetical protein